MDPCEAVRLWCIGRWLTEDDPELAEAFRRWRAPAPGRDDALPGQTVVMPWAAVVFATAFVTWTAGAAFGVTVFVVAVTWLVGEGLVRAPRRPAERRRDADPEGGSRRPGQDGDGTFPDFRRGPWF